MQRGALIGCPVEGFCVPGGQADVHFGGCYGYEIGQTSNGWLKNVRERPMVSRPTSHQLRTSQPCEPRRSDRVRLLIEEHLPLAERLACRYLRRGESIEDLVQAAAIGLINAADRFDPSFGVPFEAFATKTIMGELKRHFRDRAWWLRPPRRLQERYLEIAGEMDALSQLLGRAPSPRELADRLRVPVAEIVEALELAYLYRPRSLDSPGTFDHRSRSDERDQSMEVGAPDSSYERAESLMDLAKQVSTLSQRERLLLRLRFVDDLTQSEIAAVLGVSQMQVSRLLTHVIDKVRDRLGLLRSSSEVEQLPQRRRRPPLR